MKKKILITPFIILMFMSLKAQETNKPMKVGSFFIPEYVISSNEGLFVDLIKKLKDKFKADIKVEIYPPKRALKQFVEGSIDAYFPAVHTSLENLDYYATAPFYYKKDFLFSLRDKNMPTKKDKVCLTNGYHYSLEKLAGKTNFVFSETDTGCLKKVEKGRADYFLVELYTGLLTAKSLGLLEKIKVNEMTISALPVFFAFQKSKKGKQLSEKMDVVLQAMRESGELSRFFKETAQSISPYIDFNFEPTEP